MFFVFAPADRIAVIFMNLIAAAVGFVSIATVGVSRRSYFALVLPIVGAQLVWIHGYFAGEIFASLMLSGFYLVVLSIALLIFRRALIGAIEDHDAAEMQTTQRRSHGGGAGRAMRATGSAHIAW